MKLSKMLFAFVFFSITTNTIAEQPVLYANVKGDGTYDRALNLSDTDEARKHFPIQEYSFSLLGYDLKYDNHIAKKDQVKNLNDFQMRFHAALQLISFDQKTGNYKFKLTLRNPWLEYTGHTDGRLNMTGGEDIKGRDEVKLKLSDGSDPVFMIEGKYIEMNGKRHLINSNKNSIFDIEFSFSKIDKDIALKKLRDFSVVVVSD